MGSQWRPPVGRADRRTASSPDTPPPPPVSRSLRAPAASPRLSGAGSPPTGTHGSVYFDHPNPHHKHPVPEQRLRSSQRHGPKFRGHSGGGADVEVAGLKLMLTEAAPAPELLGPGAGQEAAYGRGGQNWERARARSRRRALLVGWELVWDFGGQSSRREFTGWLETQSLSALEKGSVA